METDNDMEAALIAAYRAGSRNGEAIATRLKEREAEVSEGDIVMFRLLLNQFAIAAITGSSEARIAAAQELEDEYIARSSSKAITEKRKQVSELFDFKPFVSGYSTPEPSLRDLVRKYYEPHFPRDRVDKLVVNYIGAICAISREMK